MCAPVLVAMGVEATTAATIGSVFSVASTAFSVFSSFQQASAQEAEGEYQEGVAQYNARVQENEAVETRNKATEEENIHRRKVAGLLSQQRAELGASGVQLTSGSALQLQENTITLGEADALRIRSNYDSQVASLETSADLTRSQGEFAKTAAENRATGTILSGIGSGLSGLASGVSDKWFTPASSAVTSSAVSMQPFDYNTNLGIA